MMKGGEKDMGILRFSVKAAQGEKPVVLQVPYAEDLNGLIGAYGDKHVYQACKESDIIAMQGIARRLLRSGASAADVATRLESWTPGTRVGGRGKKAISLEDVSVLIREKLSAKGFSSEEIENILKTLA